MLNPLLDPILARGRDRPGHLFGIFHDGAAWNEVSLRVVLDRARAVAATLRLAAVTPGATVMLVLRHGPDAPACCIGVMLAGAVPSFLPCPSAKQDHALYWSQHRAVIAFNRPAVLLVEDDLAQDMRGCVDGTGALVLPLSAISAQELTELPPLPPPSAIAILQHSSGTTGMKKGVALSYAAVARQLDAYATTLRIDPATARIASWLPLYHDMGLISSFLMPASLGVPILSIDPFVWVAHPELLFEAIERFDGTHAWMPNFAFLHLARRVRPMLRLRLDGLQALISCSEPCKPAAFDAFLERFGPWGLRATTLQTCYAMAETVFAASQSEIGAEVRRLAIDPACVGERGAIRPPPSPAATLTLLSNGRPLSGCDIAIQEGDTRLPEGHVGEICIASDYMFAGYAGNDAASRDAFRNGYYRTGDLGFIDAGEVFVVGRLKDVIIANGRNIFAHDVEAVVSALPGVKAGRCVAFGRYSDISGSEGLVVIAEPADGDIEHRTMLRAINHAVMAEVGVPCADIRLVAAGWLVKTTSGKTSRIDNARKYEKALLTGFSPPDLDLP